MYRKHNCHSNGYPKSNDLGHTLLTFNLLRGEHRFNSEWYQYLYMVPWYRTIRHYRFSSNRHSIINDHLYSHGHLSSRLHRHHDSHSDSQCQSNDLGHTLFTIYLFRHEYYPNSEWGKYLYMVARDRTIRHHRLSSHSQSDC